MSKVILKFLSFIFIWSNCLNFLQGVEKSPTKLCGTLYSKRNFLGHNFDLDLNTVVPDLKEEFIIDNKTPWGSPSLSTESFALEENCVLKVCSATYLTGKCKSLKKSDPRTINSLKNVRSLSCFHKESGKCHPCLTSAIKIPRSSCGHAYLERIGCVESGNTSSTSLLKLPCGGDKYVQFKIGGISFPEEFLSHVTSIVVKAGCSLKIFRDELQEHVVSFETGVSSNEGDIVSYECHCDAQGVTYSTGDSSSNSDPNLPSLLDIPNTMDGLLAARARMVENFHPGLNMALTSKTNKRSSINAYVLVLGSTGSGKSTLINLLFDTELTSVGSWNSVTSDIQELRVSMPLPFYSMNNTQLRIIDTPGLGDTRGPEQDAKFLATLDDYLEQHEDLNSAIPNIVLICHKFTDNRFAGPGSLFVKTLKALNLFSSRISDEHYSNVVFVFTHFLSEIQIHQKNPEQRLAEFKQVLEEFSLFPKPLVLTVADSKAAENGMYMINSNYIFPNGEHFPRNIFNKISRATKVGNDPIGFSIFDRAFKQGVLANMEFKADRDALITSVGAELVSSGHPKLQKYRDFMAATLFNVEDSEVSQHLGRGYEQNVSLELKGKYPGILPYIQRAFNIRNIRKVDDIPRTDLHTAELFSSLNQNPGVLGLLEATFSLKPPTFSGNLIVGNSYNILEDEEVSHSPKLFSFPLDSAREFYSTTELGYVFPSSLHVIKTQKIETRDVFVISEDATNLFNRRMYDLGVDNFLPSVELYYKGKPSGYNNLSVSEGDTETMTVSGIREYRIFQISLKSPFNATQMSSSFSQTLESLSPLNQSSYENVETWKSLFRQFGTHLIVSAWGGGSITITAKITVSASSSLTSMLTPQVIFSALDILGEGGNFKAKTNDITVQDTSLKFEGGDPSLHRTSFCNISTDSVSSLLTNWQKSLHLRPEVLRSSIRLIPLSHLAVPSADLITEPLQLFLNSSLTYIPSPISVEFLTQCKEKFRTAQGINKERLELLRSEVAKLQNRFVELDVEKEAMQVNHRAAMNALVEEKNEADKELRFMEKSVAIKGKCQQHKMIHYSHA